MSLISTARRPFPLVRLFFLASLGIAILNMRPCEAAPPTKEDLNKFIEAKKTEINKVNDQLGESLRNRVQQLKKTGTKGLTPVHLQRLQDDLHGFETQKTIPDSDEAADLVLRYVSDLKKQKQAIDTYKKTFSQKPNKKNPATEIDLSDLDELASSLEKKISKSDTLSAGMEFHGTREFVNSSTQLHLKITERAGDTFIGVLSQGANGNFDRMNVAGKTNGNRFHMETTSMINGKARLLIFDGTLLGSRIVANTTGKGTDGKPASGKVSLTKKQ